ncbi:MAG: hypothetical protein [Olavius algarvensis Delta 4 endosymbiont]|nr:MAG: hypothetical protein [Olavius algarvensis Delta 4 endosymbiont]
MALIVYLKLFGKILTFSLKLLVAAQGFDYPTSCFRGFFILNYFSRG